MRTIDVVYCMDWTYVCTVRMFIATDLGLVPGHLPPEERVHKVVGHIDSLQ